MTAPSINQTNVKKRGRPARAPEPVARPADAYRPYAPGSILHVSPDSRVMPGKTVVVVNYLPGVATYAVHQEGEPNRSGYVPRSEICGVKLAAPEPQEPERKTLLRVAATPPEEIEMKRAQEAEQRERQRAEIARRQPAPKSEPEFDLAALELERYIVRPVAVKPEPTPAVNLCKSSLSINPAAMQALGHPQRVALFFDRARRVMVIAPAIDGEPDTVVVNRYHGNRKSGESRTPSGSITMHGFYTRFGVGPYTTPQRTTATTRDGRLYIVLPEGVKS